MLEAAVFCLAMNIYHEARSEPAEGRKLVAYVTMNRAGWKPGKVCDTVFAERQFSWTNGAIERTKKGWGIDLSLKPKEKPAWTAAQNLARTVLMVGPVPERLGLTHYHTTTVKPTWRLAFTKVATVGSHVFYR